jgi:FkbM family methyltransferase
MKRRNVIKRFFPRSLWLPASFYYHKLKGDLEAELSLLDSLVGTRKCAVDVGANIGFYSFVLSGLCDRVEAFEPIPACADVLCAFGAKNIRVHRVGLSSSGGDRPLRVPVVGGHPQALSASFSRNYENQEEWLVPVRRLDDYRFADVSFMKIDVEGHEREVLDGGRETILREKPRLLIEIEQRHHSEPIDEVFRHVLAFGYSGSFYYREELRPLSDFDIGVHQNASLADTMKGAYVNNFIFLPVDG